MRAGADRDWASRACEANDNSARPESVSNDARYIKSSGQGGVRISDGRMSGTAYGTVVLHTAPEAAAGGPLALVRNGDQIGRAHV